MKGVVRFCKKGKLSPRYVGRSKILQRVDKVASVHPVFHISMLKECIGDFESILPIKGIGV